MRLLVFLISLLVTFVVFSVLYYFVKTKIVPGNQVHQRLKNLGGGGERVVRTLVQHSLRIRAVLRDNPHWVFHVVDGHHWLRHRLLGIMDETVVIHRNRNGAIVVERNLDWP